jgi:hypothetical protein
MDYALPLAPQLLGGAFGLPSRAGRGWLGRVNTAAYEACVFSERAAKPIVLFGGPLEALTRTTPALLLACWAPFILYCALGGKGGLSLPRAALGVLAWSLMEYAFHRFVFHARATTNLAVFAHFCLHGVHHHCPLDNLRLLMPPFLGLSVALAALALAALARLQHAHSYVCGGAVGYVFYDLSERGAGRWGRASRRRPSCLPLTRTSLHPTPPGPAPQTGHYALHHWHVGGAPSPLTALFARFQAAHKRHHIEHTHTFGVSALGAPWDGVFGTQPPPSAS